MQSLRVTDFDRPIHAMDNNSSVKQRRLSKRNQGFKNNTSKLVTADEGLGFELQSIEKKKKLSTTAPNSKTITHMKD